MSGLDKACSPVVKEAAVSGSEMISLSMVVLSIGMGPMPAIVDLWGYDVQNSSSFDRSTPITQKGSNIKTCSTMRGRIKGTINAIPRTVFW